MRNIKMLGYMALVGLLPFGACASGPMCSAKNETSWSGTLKAVNADNHTITAKSWWRTRTFNVGDNCAIKTPDNKAAALSDLRPGEKVKVCYQTTGGVKVADQIGVEPSRLTGTVKAVDPATRTVTMEEMLEHRSFRLADDCKILLWNKKEGSFADLNPGNRITVTYAMPGGSPVAYRVRERSETYTGKVDAIDLPDRTVKASELLGHKRFDLADNCQIMVNGKPTGQLNDLVMGHQYVFTYEDVDGVNVVHRIAPASESATPTTASTK